MKNKILLSCEIEKTINKLHKRIYDRFPNSSLADLCKALYNVSIETGETIKWIEKPNYTFRIFVSCILLILVILLVFSSKSINFKSSALDIFDFIQSIESGLNEIILIVAGIISIITVETRRKRSRIVKALNRLKCIAHIIDAHQLTKDPDTSTQQYIPTENSPKRTLTAGELSRYLDYCAEMLALTSKIGFLYVQNFDDPLSNNSFNELETLTTGLSMKIWQKINTLKLDELS